MHVLYSFIAVKLDLEEVLIFSSYVRMKMHNDLHMDLFAMRLHL